MLKAIYTTCFLLLSILSTAQDTLIEPSGDMGESIPTFADQMPEFPGGDMEFMKYLSDSMNLRGMDYSTELDSRIYVQFTVDTLGNASDFKVVRGHNPPVEKEVIRLLQKMPPWKPGEQNGKKVNVRYTLPVSVHLK